VCAGFVGKSEPRVTVLIDGTLTSIRSDALRMSISLSTQTCRIRAVSSQGEIGILGEFNFSVSSQMLRCELRQ